MIRTDSVDRLLKRWESLYVPDLSSLSLFRDPFVYSELIEVSSPEGRIATAAKLGESCVDLNCQFAAIQTKSLYEYVSNVLDLREAKRLTEFAFKIYAELLRSYQQASPIMISQFDRLRAMTGESSFLSWGMPSIHDLSQMLEPLLLEFQEQHIASKDWRTLGFITTQLNFTNKLLLQKLTPVEQVLISPYFKFVEEQVAVPWQRVCAAAAKHNCDSATFCLVEQMLPHSSDISACVYRQLIQTLPNHQSRRGRLDHPDIAHSCLRDLSMFQAYLWLSVLEGSLAPIQQELLMLCVMVMESVEVQWELIAEWIHWLMHEIVSRANSEHQVLLRPYVDGIQREFHTKQSRFAEYQRL